MQKNGTKNEFELHIRNILWTCESFHFTNDYTLNYINSGILGFSKEIDPKTGKLKPIIISRRTFFRYKKHYLRPEQLQQDFSYFVNTAYAIMMKGFLEELIHLHQLSAGNLMKEEEPIKRQQIIESIVKTIIPTQSAFADMIKNMIEKGKIQCQQ
jgi:hypothetical protein